MLKISPATREEINDFNLKAWHEVNVDHYGKDLEWNEQNFIFKAVDDGSIVGTITGKHESGVLYISTVIVGKNHRSKGIGGKLLAKAEEFGKSLGAHKVWLITGKKWGETKFYEKSGYNREAVLPNHHFHQDYVVYSKFL